MNQRRVGDKLYVLDMTPYVITKDTDAEIIYVQQEKLDGYLALNPTLANKITTINYLVYTVKPKEWAGVEPTKEDTNITLTQGTADFEQESSYDIANYVSNPNNLDFDMDFSVDGTEIDPEDNSYLTLNDTTITSKQTVTFDLDIDISRQADAQYDALEPITLRAAILPTAEQEEVDAEDAGTSFDDQTSELEMYLTQDGIDAMSAAETEAFAKNLINYHAVLSCDYFLNGARCHADWLTRDTLNGDIIIGHLTQANPRIVTTLFTITIEHDSEHDTDDYTVTLNENINWVNITKPAATDIYVVTVPSSVSNDVRISVDGGLTGYYLAPEIDTNKEYVTTNSTFKILSWDSANNEYTPLANYESYIENCITLVNVSGTIYRIKTGPTSNVAALPVVDDYKTIVMHDPQDTGYDLDITVPAGETWFAGLSYANTNIDVEVGATVVNSDNIWLTENTGVELWKNGLKGATGNVVTPISGITAGAITDGNKFVMPAGDVEVSVAYNDQPEPPVETRQYIEEIMADPTGQGVQVYEGLTTPQQDHIPDSMSDTFADIFTDDAPITVTYEDIMWPVGITAVQSYITIVSNTTAGITFTVDPTNQTVIDAISEGTLENVFYISLNPDDPNYYVDENTYPRWAGVDVPVMEGTPDEE